jgi:thioredoxin 2
MTGPGEQRGGVGQGVGNQPLGTPAPSGSGTAPGPESILICASCGKRNRIRPSEKGAPHCGSCGKPLPWVINATDATFEVEARTSVAVLVDLWAPWCGPCRFVSPILEELARDFAGRLKVVKVNVDENPALSQRFEAMSIPTLVILRGGRVVDRVVGALPKSQLTIRLTPHLLRR